MGGERGGGGGGGGKRRRDGRRKRSMRWRNERQHLARVVAR